MLHFGVLNISAGILRRLGINVTSLFKDPIRSRSLNEFWSKRWNLAFVELTTIAVLRPVKSIYGPGVAFWVSFVFSGLLHELAISLPVKSGFGKPFAYFIIQAILIMTIDSFLIKKLKNHFIRTLAILTCLFLPIFLLFHKQFILQIILPLVEFLKIY
jgi:alginate O-acetyltransferase complex protein AlgI